jgi:hypothetical protein
VNRSAYVLCQCVGWWIIPYVLVRLRCDACKRTGSYRLARLAVKYGAEILLGRFDCEAIG